MAALEVIRPGMLTLVQDVGRLGVGDQGLSQGGAVDIHAYCWANYLLGNEMGCPQLEITLGQASFKARGDLICAITGADMAATLDGEPVVPWRSFQWRDGQVLKLAYPRAGLRAYLAVKGGLDVPTTLGSSSTVVRNSIGGIESGRALLSGDRLDLRHSVDETVASDFESQFTPIRFIPDYASPVQLRVIESYQSISFSDKVKQNFYQGEYKISQQTDRMGCRLEGPPIAGEAEGIISEGIAYGAIQIPPNGQPIILLNDRQTLGGYPKLGCIARVDMPKLAQAAPGSMVRFSPGDLDTLQQEWQLFSRFFALPF
ncbi:biotin-dependent carboxyltransferase family protein [Photobacterium sp. SDRW27]|uniref:5-oxoprolinase subunit C family protein n=1 Tax=Photobacterium obscurum TaxID=2829490 RepID=UPI002243FED6|nr:biotin-dependent carboxyltransferase family protein [Photobacterium obscurum]MCW8331214.1 biotin-dependent carboxyltransferase family protein [Photobacterium obscurum]